jgi:hypothetical protein
MKNAVWSRLAELSEDELRTQVVVPMLERTPGLEQVTVNRPGFAGDSIV